MKSVSASSTTLLIIEGKKLLILLLLLLLQHQSFLFFGNLFLFNPTQSGYDGLLYARSFDELNVKGLFVLDLLGNLAKFLRHFLQVHLERIQLVFLLNLHPQISSAIPINIVI